MADRLVQAARDALPTTDAAVARAVLAADLALLGDLDAQVDQATEQLARLLPQSPFAPLLTVPGWGCGTGRNYGGALGDPARFNNHRQVYRTAGLNLIEYESAGKRRDSVISREGSVELRRALIDLGVGLWLNDPAAKAHGTPATRPRQEGPDHRLRDGRSRQPHRLRTRARPKPATTPADRPGRTNPRGLHNSGLAPGSRARRTRTRRRDSYCRRRQDAMPLLGWRPGPSPFATARTKPDDPHPRRGRIRQRGHPAPTAKHAHQHAPPPAPAGESMKHAHQRT